MTTCDKYICVQHIIDKLKHSFLDQDFHRKTASSRNTLERTHSISKLST